MATDPRTSLPPLTTNQRLTLAIGSSMVAEVTTYPLDFIKTKLQIQGEYAKTAANNSIGKNGKVAAASSQQRLGMTRIAYKSIRKEGALSLYKGISPAMLRHLVYSGVRMPLYETARDYFNNKSSEKNSNQQNWETKTTSTTTGKPPKTKIPQGLTLWQAMVIAGASGGFAQWLASPTDLIKVQMQTGQAKSLSGAMRHLYKQGPSSWWRGATPNVGRAIFVNQGDLMTYDRVKVFMINNQYLEEGYKLHFFASLSAGFVACCFAMPADTIKTRLMNQPIVKGKGVYYTGVIHCVRVMLKNEGFFSFYRGFFSAWPRMGLWSQMYWHTNESLRGVFGLKPF